MRKMAGVALAAFFGSGSILFTLAFHDRYWRWRDCFNELGRCYDSDSQQVFLEQAGLVWRTFAVACLVLCMLSVWRLKRGR